MKCSGALGLWYANIYTLVLDEKMSFIQVAMAWLEVKNDIYDTQLKKNGAND